MSVDNTESHEPRPQPPPEEPPGQQTLATGRTSYVWLYVIGFLLPILLLCLFFLFGGNFSGKKTTVTQIKPLQLQVSILEGLQSEIDMYQAALDNDVCTAVPLPSAIPRPVAPGVAPTPGATSQSLETLPEMIEQATVMVLSDSPQSISSGTAFFIGQGLLLTNSHVVANVINGGGQVSVTSKTLGGLVEAKLVGHSDLNSLRDYALLTVELPSGNYPTPLPLTPEARRTQRVSSWGYPTLLTRNDPSLAALLEGDLSSTPEVIYSEGAISVIQEQGGLAMISHTAEVSQGNSGGPLVNEQGQVVGINTMIQVDDKSSRQVNIALSSSDILAFISELGLTLPIVSKGE